MNPANTTFIDEVLHVWSSGGWLMLPLFILTVYIYFSVLHLFFSLTNHFLLKVDLRYLTPDELDQNESPALRRVRGILMWDAETVEEVRRHFQEVRNEYLPMVNRRIRFVAIIVTTGPLIGLLGTVTGMLAAFSGMLLVEGDKFENVAEGISEALITTQAGLMISIPAYVVISLIIQERNKLEYGLARLEQHNIRHVLERNVRQGQIASR